MTGHWRTLAGLAWRESRSARRRLFLASSSITLGVTALVAIDSFAANVTRSVREQSRALVGGDISLSARRPFSPAVERVVDSLARTGVRTARETTFPAMAVLPRSGATRFVQMRAVTDAYPLYGVITTEPAGRWRTLRAQTTALVDPALLIALNASVGDTLQVGYARFVIAGVVRDAPGVPGIAQVLGPRVYIPARFLPETQLLVLGSTASYEVLLRIERGDVTAIARALRKTLRTTGARVRTAEETETGLTEAVGQLGQFIGIVGMVALLLGGLGVASGVHAFVARKIDTVAVLRCLGATSRQVLTMYVAQAAAMGLVGAAMGAMLGVAVQLVIPHLVADFLPVNVAVHPEPRAILLGLAVGGWVALIFALQPLLALRHVSPLQTLRRDVDASALAGAGRDFPQIAVLAAMVLSVVAIAFARAGRVRTAAGVSVGTGAAILALLASGALLTLLARRSIRPRWPYALRQGLGNLYRPGNQTRAVILALGFGAFLVATLELVQTSLLNRFQIVADASGANVVFFDVQPDQVSGANSIAATDGAALLQTAPVVTMRVAAIKGVPVSKLLADTVRARSSARWALSWEYRTTYRDTLNSSERIVAGKWFAGQARKDTAEISLEKDIAQELRVRVGDVITWNVQGIDIPSRVTSLREVKWVRFEPNFFVVFRPGALDAAPKQFVLVARTAGPAATGRMQRAMVARYPNVASLDLSVIRESLDAIVRRVAAAVRFLALFSLAMGVPVMLSAVAATRRDRIRETVLLKTLGATRATVAKILTVEYAALGVLGSLTGIVLAVAAAYALVRFAFKADFVPAIRGPLLISVAMIALTIGIGLATAREVFRRTPMEALRDS